VFSKICKERTSTTCWIYLGMALIQLEELEAAEDAITQANILDNNNPTVWGLSCLLCLKYGSQRVTQARFCLKNALSLGIKDVDLISQIGELLEKSRMFTEVMQIYSIVPKIDPKNGEILEKLGYLYCNEENPLKDREASVECLKKAVELVKGENNKTNIVQTLQALLISLNREFELNQYLKYLPDAGGNDHHDDFD